MEYLYLIINNEPKFNKDTFILRDFHYANILWDSYEVTDEVRKIIKDKYEKVMSINTYEDIKRIK